MKTRLETEKIVALTVTYNSASFLQHTVEALLKQTYEVSKIIIVDNASNERNREVINQIMRSASNIIVLWMDNNGGGAGGFEAGFKYIMNNLEYDWIWLMDDDAYPQNNCLEELLKYKDGENVGCLAPLIFGIDNQEYQLYHFKKVIRFGSKDKAVFDAYDKIPEISRIDADAFVGPLVSRKTVEMVGIPNGSLFIYGDDQEYTYRISRKYNIYLIKSAVMYHRDVSSSASGSPKAWWKDYYMHRNRLLFVKEFAVNKFEANIGKLFVILGIYKRIILAYLSLKGEWRLKRIDILKRSISDGLKGNTGKLLNPDDHIAWYNRQTSERE